MTRVLSPPPKPAPAVLVIAAFGVLCVVGLVLMVWDLGSAAIRWVRR